MMKHPLVSVIVPNYNHAPYLEDRLNSILNQQYDNIEVIILDDKSTDDSVRILKRFEKCPRVSSLILNDENSGSPFKQWVKGFEYVTGELIWIAESDDSCDSHFLQTLVAEFEADSNCVLAYCRSKKIGMRGELLGEVELFDNMHVNGRHFIKKYLSRYNYISNASSAIFSKKVLENMDLSYTQFRGCGDWIFWVEVSKCGHVIYVNKPLNYFRQHNSNTTTQQTYTGKGEFEVCEVMNYMRNKGYIGQKDFFRAKIVHLYSICYGKQSSVLSHDTIIGIRKKWRYNYFVGTIIWFLYLLRCMGIEVVKR